MSVAADMTKVFRRDGSGGAENMGPTQARAANDELYTTENFLRALEKHNRDQARIVLDGATKTRVACVVVNIESSAVANGHFLPNEDDSVRIEFDSSADHATFKVLTPCAVTFCIGSRALSFISSVAAFAPTNAAEAGRAKLELSAPGTILGFECRRTFRISTLENVRLMATLRGDDGLSIDALRVKDISMSGVGLVIDEELESLPEVGDILEIRLENDTITAIHRAEVRQVSAQGIGLCFDGLDTESPDDDVDLRVLVSMVEREWLRRRANE